jgi:hypothetical protein
MPSLFISYAHVDMKPTDWLERLTLYLAPLRKRGDVEIWADSKLEAGDQWKSEIDGALQRATAVILLVGPGFLGSSFISKVELPTILESARRAGTRIYPLVVGYCSYRSSELEPYQAFNDPEKPLEALSTAEQNKSLNELSQKVDSDIREKKIAAKPAQEKRGPDLRSVVLKMSRLLESNHTVFQAQVRRRNALVAAVERRLEIKERPQYETFFFRYQPLMNEEELFEFNQIRAMTAGIHDGNQDVLTILDEQPELLEEADVLIALRQHLVFWLNKYDRVFEKEPKMALLYTGVEDGVPFPNKVDQQVKAWLRDHP